LIDADSICSLIIGLFKAQKALGTSPIQTGIEKKEEILSIDDWNAVMFESRCNKFKKDEIIIKEGEWSMSLYQIGKGKCKVVDTKNTVLGYMNSGEMFGEISFLEGVKTSANIISDEDDTEVYIIEGHSLKILFTRQPALAGRLYEYLSSILSERLNEREISFHSK